MFRADECQRVTAACLVALCKRLGVDAPDFTLEPLDGRWMADIETINELDHKAQKTRRPLHKLILELDPEFSSDED